MRSLHWGFITVVYGLDLPCRIKFKVGLLSELVSLATFISDGHKLENAICQNIDVGSSFCPNMVHRIAAQHPKDSSLRFV